MVLLALTMGVSMITMDQAGIGVIGTAEAVLRTTETVADDHGKPTIPGIILEIPGIGVTTTTGAGRGAIAGVATATGGKGEGTANLEIGLETGIDPASDLVSCPRNGRGIGRRRGRGNDPGTGRERDLWIVLVTDGIDTPAEGVMSAPGALDTVAAVVRATVGRSEVPQMARWQRREMLPKKDLKESLMQPSRVPQ